MKDLRLTLQGLMVLMKKKLLVKRTERDCFTIIMYQCGAQTEENFG